jgi:DNA repair exonuclease SbcCD ATPase subunit
MLTIRRLKLRAWKCFEAVDLELEPRDYAIVAHSQLDPDRSNWLGKSSLQEAVDFALHGRLSEAVRGKSGWITRGSKSGEVELVLSDGTRIVRSKGVRGPEKVWCFPEERPADKGAVGDEAEKLVGELVGLTREDFIATCYFQQRQMARLVLCAPSLRMEMVGGWIRLGPLQECEDMAGEVLAALTKKRDALLDQARANDAAVADYLGGPNLPEQIDATYEQELVRCAALVADLERRVSIARDLQEETVRRDALALSGVRYEAIVAEGKRLAGEQQAASSDAPRTLELLKARVRELGEQLGVVDRDASALRKVAEGRFDGVCPIVGKTCPAREFVVTTANRDRQIGAEKDQAAKELRAEYEKASQQQARLSELIRENDRREVRMRDLREEARRLKPSHEQWRALGEAGVGVNRGNVMAIEHELADARAAMQTLKNVKQRVDAKLREAEEARAQAKQLESAIQTAREGLAIFGKNGAQRRAAEGALGEIEQEANGSLERCAIDLSVRMVWSRDGSGLAAACGQCGAAYPASARVKNCERCGAERGPNLVNRLEVDVSDRSGGADDLAGAVVQLAASRWLRDDRGSRWGVALIDEPFGQMDAANRRAFAARLPTLLREAGFAQSLTIAHHPGVLDALPGRIEIVSDGRRSTARVV